MTDLQGVPKGIELASEKPGFAQSSLIYLTSSALSAAIPFLILPFMTRWLGTEDFGRLGVYLSLVNILGAATGLSTHGLVGAAYYREGPDKLREYAGTALGIAFTLATIFTFSLYFFAAKITQISGIPQQWVPTLGIVALCQFVFFVGLSVFQVRSEPLRYAALQISLALGTAILSVLLVGYFDMGLDGRFLAQVLVSLFALLSIAIVLTLANQISWNPKKWHLKEALAFGLPTVPHSLAAIWMGTVDRLALSYQATARDIGLYFLGVQIATVLSMAGLAVNQAWLPRLYALIADKSKNSDRTIVRLSFIAMAVIILVSLALILALPVIIFVAGGTEFSGSYPFAMILIFTFMFNTMYYFVAGFYFYHSKTGTLASITVCAALVQTLLTFWLIGVLGPIGVAWATLGGSAFYFFTTWLISNRIHPLPWFSSLKRQLSIDEED